MVQGNASISEFILLGVSEEPELKPIIFGLFLSMYLITVLGNLPIILAVSSDSHLHTPMYFFLSNLSLVDICFTSTTIPKMVWNIQTQNKVITYEGCITQMHFFLLFAGLDNFLLTVMAYDRYVAICQPLHYTVIMNPRLCGLLVLIVSSIRGIPSAQGKYKAFSTCASHLSVVSLFYCASLGVYLSSAATQSSHSSATASVMYVVVTPMLNPFIYSLKNKDIKEALKRFVGITGIKWPVVLGMRKCPRLQGSKSWSSQHCVEVPSNPLLFCVCLHSLSYKQVDPPFHNQMLYLYPRDTDLVP
ncbi:hypothetical protein QTO34_015365 [Cnephaeus nilssonii]|uniref:Olfactory receptor n=1 Tax=Cnephaeus nilssonii TaxID=3371016 RepID=A0AA40LT06_CNENI|nr:hypothetical protein QTO34_015365 [Eptesicus nilssonii]